MNKLYRQLFIERVRFGIASARAVSSLQHSGVKGAIREVLVADLFRPLLPADIGLASGVLISATGDNQSAQQDIVVFDKEVLPPVTFEGGLAIIPVESAIATIEVKSCLSATELKNAHANATTVRDLPFRSGVLGENNKWLDVPQPGVTSVLFALDSDLVPGEKTEIERYRELFGEGPAVLRAMCIAGRGAWFPSEPTTFDKVTHQYDSPSSQSWHEVLADNEHSEVLTFIAGVHSVILRRIAARGRPPFLDYLS